MKPQTLPVKRRPVPKGILHRLSAVTRNRKQRVTATATAPPADLEVDDGGSKISRALTIIFLIHILAIALIFVHQRFLDSRPSDGPAVAKTGSTTAATPVREDLPRLSSGEKAYVVQAGDNYTRIAASEGVDEGDLRTLNKQQEIYGGLILKIPPKRIVAQEPPEVASIRDNTPSDLDRGLVEAVDVTNAPKAQLVRPNVSHPAAATRTPAATPTVAPATTGKAYVVQPGDSVWRIANRFKVSQDHLMRANGISDARKMKTGMKLVIP